MTTNNPYLAPYDPPLTPETQAHYSMAMAKVAHAQAAQTPTILTEEQAAALYTVLRQLAARDRYPVSCEGFSLDQRCGRGTRGCRECDKAIDEINLDDSDTAERPQQPGAIHP